jgi:hypothetical protein
MQGTKGGSVALAAKLSPRGLTAVGLNLSRAAGPVLKAEASLMGGKRATRVKADVKLRAKEVKMEVMPPPLNKKCVRVCCARSFEGRGTDLACQATPTSIPSSRRQLGRWNR